jgi:hypothetical protein
VPGAIIAPTGGPLNACPYAAITPKGHAPGGNGWRGFLPDGCAGASGARAYADAMLPGENSRSPWAAAQELGGGLPDYLMAALGGGGRRYVLKGHAPGGSRLSRAREIPLGPRQHAREIHYRAHVLRRADVRLLGCSPGEGGRITRADRDNMLVGIEVFPGESAAPVTELAADGEERANFRYYKATPSDMMAWGALITGTAG